MANRLIDGGLNIWTSATALTNWSKGEAGTSTVNRESTTVYEGLYSCRLDVDGSNSSVSIYQSVKLVPGRKYRLSIWYMMSAADKTAAITLYDSGPNVYLHSDGTWGASADITLPNSISWKQYSIEFTAHASYSDYTLILKRGTATSSSIYLDDVRLESRDVCGFFWDNEWDAGTLTASGEATNFPATNTRHRWHLRHWRSTALASPEWLKNNAGAAVDVKAVFIKANNFTTGATIKIQANATDVWTSPTVDKTLTLNTDIMVALWPTAQSYQWWRLSMTDASNPDGYVRVGRIFVGPIFEPTRNIRMGSGTFQEIDPSLVSESENGQTSTIRRTHYRTISLQFQGLRRADYDTLIAHFVTAGVDKDFFFCLDLGDPWNETYYVRYASPPAWTQRHVDYYDVTIRLEELR